MLWMSPPLSLADPVARLGAALASDLRLACMDPFMSHVLEKLLIIATFTKEGEGEVKEEVEEKLEEEVAEELRGWVVKVCKFVINNMEDFCQDTYASHILRTAVQVSSYPSPPLHSSSSLSSPPISSPLQSSPLPPPPPQCVVGKRYKEQGKGEQGRTEGYDLMTVPKGQQGGHMEEVGGSLTPPHLTSPQGSQCEIWIYPIQN